MQSLYSIIQCRRSVLVSDLQNFGLSRMKPQRKAWAALGLSCIFWRINFCVPQQLCRLTLTKLNACGPVAATPPPVIPTATSEPLWTECFLQTQRGQSSSQEVWLFRSDTSSGFEKFLKHRHFNLADTATCRSISPDSSIQCLECTRVIFGGVYGSLGVLVPAYPPEGQAVGCLSRNRIVEADFDDDDNYDGNPTREVALCNSHRGHLDSMPLFQTD